jgi:hypothetical protein
VPFQKEKIGRAQNLKPSSFLIRASVLEIIRQPEDPHDSNQMENEQEAPNPCSGVSVFEDFVREKLKLDGTSGNKAHREDEEKYGENQNGGHFGQCQTTKGQDTEKQVPPRHRVR